MSAGKLCCVKDFWVGSDSIFINNFWVSSSPCGLVIFAPYVFPVNQFPYWIMLSAANQFSLPNCGINSESILAVVLWCQQRISSRCWIVVLATNQFLLPNLWSQQRISFCCWTVVSTANQFSLPNYVSATNQFLLSNSVLPANQFHRRFYIPANQFADKSASPVNQFCRRSSTTYYIS